MSADDSDNKSRHSHEQPESPSPCPPEEIKGAENHRIVSNPQHQNRANEAADFVAAMQQAAKGIKWAALGAILAACVSVGTLITGITQCTFNKAQVVEMKLGSQLTKESLVQNQKAFDATAAASRLDQRAWIGVREMALATPEVGKPLSARISVFNSGTTFAKEQSSLAYLVASEITFATGEELRRHAESTSTFPGKGSIGVTPPSGDFVLILNHPHPLTKEDLELISSGKWKIHVIGEIKYQDIFRETHSTKFCSIYSFPNKAFETAPYYNDAD